MLTRVTNEELGYCYQALKKWICGLRFHDITPLYLMFPLGLWCLCVLIARFEPPTKAVPVLRADVAECFSGHRTYL